MPRGSGIAFIVHSYLHIRAKLYDIKYSYQIQIFCTLSYAFEYSSNNLVVSSIFLFNNSHLFAHSHMTSSH